jgi:hypothetical protein
VSWTVVFHPDFEPEFGALALAVQDELLAAAVALREKGPALGRPLVDTLKGSKVANLRELRFSADGGVWRVAFAFDPRRRAVLLVAGDKSGVAPDRFYRPFIRRAERRFENWNEEA